MRTENAELEAIRQLIEEEDFTSALARLEFIEPVSKEDKKHKEELKKLALSGIGLTLPENDNWSLTTGGYLSRGSHILCRFRSGSQAYRLLQLLLDGALSSRQIASQVLGYDETSPSSETLGAARVLVSQVNRKCGQIIQRQEGKYHLQPPIDRT